jgi:hypothetical protein
MGDFTSKVGDQALGNEPYKLTVNPTAPQGAINNNLIYFDPAYYPGPWGSTTSLQSGWRVKTVGNDVELSLDVPGSQSSDLNVIIECGLIKVTGKRSDTGWCVGSNYNLGNDYDPKTATASVTSGVLTVTLQRFKERAVYQVTVTNK